MAGKGGGAWKVAYADFVTAMMAFFLVMWLVGQSSKVKESVAEHFKEPVDPFRAFQGRLMFKTTPSNGHKGNWKKPYTKTQNPPAENPDDPDSPKPRYGTTRDSEHTGIGLIVYFAEDGAELRPEDRRRLEQFLPLVQGKPQKIEIRGHASRRPQPADSPLGDAWQLSFSRSLTVLKFFQDNGIAPERLRLSQAGGYEPYTTRIEPQWQAKNSRVEVRMLGEFAEEFVGTRDERDERWNWPGKPQDKSL